MMESVSSDVKPDRDGDDELTFDEAVTRFESGEPPQLALRPRRTVRVIYHQCGGGWHATSPELSRLDQRGPTYRETKQRVAEWLDSWIDPEVTVIDHMISESEAVASKARIELYTSGPIPIELSAPLHGRTSSTARSLDLDLVTA